MAKEQFERSKPHIQHRYHRPAADHGKTTPDGRHFQDAVRRTTARITAQNDQYAQNIDSRLSRSASAVSRSPSPAISSTTDSPATTLTSTFPWSR